ncbi:VOC family protein [Streptomyces sp. NPDC047002]|uniref:VOC family protein n=1 Tax=Streptomyces sp. NPDC047002 TaxID=3155475 RepID=UPI0034514BD4
MAPPPSPLRMAGPVLSTPEPARLAAFYAGLLGRLTLTAEEDWVKLGPPEGEGSPAFQRGPGFVPPEWPGATGRPRTTAHLDIGTDDLDAGAARAVERGARVAPHQPADDVRVCLDPAGHVFCLPTRT